MTIITNPARMLPAWSGWTPRGLLSPKPTHNVLSSGWLWESLHMEKRREVIDRAKAALAKIHFDALAVTGISGILVGSVVAMEMDKPLIIVRKRGEQRHSAYDVEGVFGVETYVILDDFVSSGSTIGRIERKIIESAKLCHIAAPRCLGVVEYGACTPRWNPRWEWDVNLWFESKHDPVAWRSQ